MTCALVSVFMCVFVRVCARVRVCVCACVRKFVRVYCEAGKLQFTRVLLCGLLCICDLPTNPSQIATRVRLIGARLHRPRPRCSIRYIHLQLVTLKR